MLDKKLNYPKLARTLQKDLARSEIPLGEHVATAFKVSGTPYNPISFQLRHEVVEEFQKANTISNEELYQLLSYLVRNDLISLTEVPEGGITRLFFKTSVETFIELKNQTTVFVIREFNNESTMKVYESSIKPSIQKLKLEPLMLEDKEHAKAANLNNYIKSSIGDSLAIICDITPKSNLDINWNPNVFFEAGMADGFNKTIIYIADQKIRGSVDKLPFDMSSHTVFFYESSNVDDLSNYLKRQLMSIIKSIE